jgi:hypothetical protein
MSDLTTEARRAAAMELIHGDPRLGVLPLEIKNTDIMRQVREALNESTETPNEDLPEIAAAKQTALLEIYNTAKDPAIQDIALRGLYGRLPREAA